MSLPKIPPKQQMLLMGYISIAVSLMCIVFVATVFPMYLKLHHSSAYFTSEEVSAIVLCLLVIQVCVGAYSAISARALFRNRKYVMDEMPAKPDNVCAECSGTFKREDMIAVGEHLVCAKCKPAFIQKLTEGAASAKKRV
jgi:hypothetical protein